MLNTTSHPLVFAFTETWLIDDAERGIFSLGKHLPIRITNRPRRGGGMVIHVSKNSEIKLLRELKKVLNWKNNWSQKLIKKYSLVLATLYRASQMKAGKFLDLLLECNNNNNNKVFSLNNTLRIIDMEFVNEFKTSRKTDTILTSLDCFLQWFTHKRLQLPLMYRLQWLFPQLLWIRAMVNQSKMVKTTTRAEKICLSMKLNYSLYDKLQNLKRLI